MREAHAIGEQRGGLRWSSGKRWFARRCHVETTTKLVDSPETATVRDESDRSSRAPPGSPENSIASFEAAVALGADGIECDIHTTSDGQLVVLHDYQLDGVAARSGVVRDLTFEHLQAFSARIPLRAEVLSIDCPSFELEIKTLDPRSIEKIVALTEEFGVIDTVEFTSSFISALAFVRSLSEDVGVGVFCRHS